MPKTPGRLLLGDAMNRAAILGQGNRVDANDLPIRKLLSNDRLGAFVIGVAENGDQDNVIGNKIVAVSSIREGRFPPWGGRDPIDAVPGQRQGNQGEGLP